MERLPRNLFPSGLEQVATTIFGTTSLAAILLKQPQITGDLACLPADAPIMVAQLHPNEMARFGNYRLPKRRAEFLTGRVCAKMALESFWAKRSLDLSAPLGNIEIANDTTGRPYAHIEDLSHLLAPEISITHGGAYGAALVAESPCGIDLQQQRDNLVRVREKYCSLEEVQLLGALLPDTSLLPRLSLLWAAKEAAKKALSSQQMPGFLELELTQVAKNLPHSLSLILDVKVRNNVHLPGIVTVLTTIFGEYAVAICILQKEHRNA
jgi:4'-phosphopantetheinyl transferase EntD